MEVPIVYSRDEIAAEFPGVPNLSDRELLKTDFTRRKISRVYDWRNYASGHAEKWKTYTPLKRLIIYIRSYEEAMREEWD